MNLFVYGDKQTEPTLEFSWEETTFSYSIQREWTGDTRIVEHSGTYEDTYIVDVEEYNGTDVSLITGIRSINHKANYSYTSETRLIGNVTMNIAFQVYRVDIDYGPNVKVIWLAFKQGTIDLDFYLTSHIQNFSYYEEYNQIIESDLEKYNYQTDELLDAWVSTDEVIGEKNYTYIHNSTREPFFYYWSDYSEYSLPLILTIQIFKTEKGDRIAWINMVNDFIIYKDLDGNGIFSVADREQMVKPPTLYTSDERCGYVKPFACDRQLYKIEYMEPHNPDDIPDILDERLYYPKDKAVNEMAATIEFTPPNSTSDANVTWGIKYPEWPTYASIMGKYYSPINVSHVHTHPTDYSYEFDYTIGTNYTNMDVTWEMGKITNTSLYDAAQGYGLVLPQYNYFLASFDIDEIDTKELTVPCDKFSFESNDTLVAELNMGGPDKQEYTLFDFPTSGVDTEIESKGGNVHPLVYVFEEFSSHYDEPFVNCLYTLTDIVEQDPTFGIEDSLYRVQTQNYPEWNGERLRHDPTLTVYFEEYEVEEEIANGGKKPFIPGYNCALLIGTVGVITLIIVLEKRKKKFNLT